MESDSVFHNLLGCMELLPGLHAVFAIPDMNALPVHCANQVSNRLLSRFFRNVFPSQFSGSPEGLWAPSGSF